MPGYGRGLPSAAPKGIRLLFSVPSPKSHRPFGLFIDGRLFQRFRANRLVRRGINKNIPAAPFLSTGVVYAVPRQPRAGAPRPKT